MSDIIVLVADNTIRLLIEALFERLPSCDHVKPFSYKVIVDNNRDPGVYNNAHKLLGLYHSTFSYAMTICDHEGCGVEHHHTREQVEAKIEEDLGRHGWANNCLSIVIDPEVENWIWVHHSHMHRIVDWKLDEDIYTWAKSNHYLREGELKPQRPKETFEAILKLSRTPMSSALYRDIARKASYKKCIDPAFQKMIQKLREWFPLPQD